MKHTLEHFSTVLGLPPSPRRASAHLHAVFGVHVCVHVHSRRVQRFWVCGLTLNKNMPPVNELRELAAGTSSLSQPKAGRITANIWVTALFTFLPVVWSLAAVASVFKQCAQYVGNVLFLRIRIAELHPRLTVSILVLFLCLFPRSGGGAR